MFDYSKMIKRAIEFFPQWCDIRKRHQTSVGGRLMSSILEESLKIEDAIEEYINLGDVALRIADTAGIRETDDKIESLGIDKSREYINKAELVLFVVDSSDEITKDDLEIYDTVKGKNLIILCNKSDLGKIKDLSKGQFKLILLVYSIINKKNIFL